MSTVAREQKLRPPARRKRGGAPRVTPALHGGGSQNGGARTSRVFYSFFWQHCSRPLTIQTLALTGGAWRAQTTLGLEPTAVATAPPKLEADCQQRLSQRWWARHPAAGRPRWSPRAPALLRWGQRRRWRRPRRRMAAKHLVALPRRLPAPLPPPPAPFALSNACWRRPQQQQLQQPAQRQHPWQRRRRPSCSSRSRPSRAAAAPARSSSCAAAASAAPRAAGAAAPAAAAARRRPSSRAACLTAAPP